MSPKYGKRSIFLHVEHLQPQINGIFSQQLSLNSYLTYLHQI